MNVFDRTTPTLDADTFIVDVREVDKGAAIIALDRNIVRPQIGGYPRDYARLSIKSRSLEVLDVPEIAGKYWLAVGIPAVALSTGVAVRIQVDRNRRERLTRLHTLSHIIGAAAKTVLRGYDFVSCSICANALNLRFEFRAHVPLDVRRIREIDKLARSYVCADADVPMSKSPFGLKRYPAEHCPNIGRGDDRLDKSHFVDFAQPGACPCPDLLVSSTAAIRAFSVIGGFSDESGNCELQFSLQDSWNYWY